MEKLLIVDDSPEICKQLKWGLGKIYRVMIAQSVDEALNLFAEHSPKVVTLDLGLPPDIDGASEGLRCLQEMLKTQPSCKVIVLSGNEDHANALAAVDMGAYDFYRKPIDLAELKIILSRAYQLASLEDENRRLQSAESTGGEGYQGMFGNCAQMQHVFATIKKVASVDVPVLILGESGTGKEMVAQAIHSRGVRKEGKFIAINCGAIPENLLESELFGHEKGSFTGAQARVKGKVEFADQGTLFLDEIGEMPAMLQVKMLRFLQDKLVQRVGGREDIPVDTRVIAATNIDINDAMKNGEFREDLYYRLGVITIELPPLRERGEDLELLANVFLRRFSHEFDIKARGFSAATLQWFGEYDWPGNVRELENKIKRAIVMAETPILEPWDLGFTDRPDSAGTATAGEQETKVESMTGQLDLSSMTLKDARHHVEHILLQQALEQNQGNIQKAAEQLSISRPTLYDLLKKHGLHS